MPANQPSLGGRSIPALSGAVPLKGLMQIKGVPFPGPEVTPLASDQAIQGLSQRLRLVRLDWFGAGVGLRELARQLGIPACAWYSYESGIMIPGDVLLRFIDLTGVSPGWLLHGRGPRYEGMDPPAPAAGKEPAAESREWGRLLRRLQAIGPDASDGSGELSASSSD